MRNYKTRIERAGLVFRPRWRLCIWVSGRAVHTWLTFMGAFPFLKGIVVAGNYLRQATPGAGGDNQKALFDSNFPMDEGRLFESLGQRELFPGGLSTLIRRNSSANRRQIYETPAQNLSKA